MLQARSFYRAMTAAQRQDLEEAVAEDIFFLDSGLQERITALIARGRRAAGGKHKAQKRLYNIACRIVLYILEKQDLRGLMHAPDIEWCAREPVRHNSGRGSTVTREVFEKREFEDPSPYAAKAAGEQRKEAA